MTLERLSPRMSEPPGMMLRREGRGVAPAHNGEMLQGALRCSNGIIRRFLVTLRCPLFRSVARFRAAGPEEERWRTTPGDRSKAERAARLTLDRLGHGDLGGELEIDSTIPMGRGMGSSTSDCLAASSAVSAAFHARLRPEELARLVVQAETAADATMFRDAAVVFAHREGAVIESFEADLPPFEVLGFDAAPEAADVDTLSFDPAAYDDDELRRFARLLDDLRRGIATQDHDLVGRVATESALINQRYLPKARLPALLELSTGVGACGLQVSHSGTVAGLLFDSARADHELRVEAAITALREMGIDDHWRFLPSLRAMAPAGVTSDCEAAARGTGRAAWGGA